jgi:hypothetical protein
MIDLKKIADGLKIEPKLLTELDDIIKKAGYNISPDVAKELLVRFWAYKSMTTEWITKATKYERECGLQKKHTFSKCKALSPESSEAGKTRWAEEQPEYQKADIEATASTLFREHLSMKRDDLREGHYMVKTVMESLREDWQMTPDRKRDI